MRNFGRPQVFIISTAARDVPVALHHVSHASHEVHDDEQSEQASHAEEEYRDHVLGIVCFQGRVTSHVARVWNQQNIGDRLPWVCLEHDQLSVVLYVLRAAAI